MGIPKAIASDDGGEFKRHYLMKVLIILARLHTYHVQIASQGLLEICCLKAYNTQGNNGTDCSQM